MWGMFYFRYSGREQTGVQSRSPSLPFPSQHDFRAHLTPYSSSEPAQWRKVRKWARSVRTSRVCPLHWDCATCIHKKEVNSGLDRSWLHGWVCDFGLANQNIPSPWHCYWFRIRYVTKSGHESPLRAFAGNYCPLKLLTWQNVRMESCGHL